MQAKFRFSDSDKKRMHSIIFQLFRAVALAFRFLKAVKLAEKGFKTGH
ncbi:hypothetical protein JCM14244_14140 [Venenivibrio stagnispumantis]|uniref:Uncharacterized protein n=1 Tax=Venenivibrio stagnispumantis TaxID=407998 RepID=A0AA46AE56_9AQUI|nr:hypothetical protein [Venenivibrio stagnispumantis]MCW4573699.1 hypothetical protein [Venenivibrio stagnispumantis]SMP10022.1 hypothetical protein SAMN06264868_10759 [Venenivibrio stagnispumantis]